ncbi:RusA family crossover junction endodeoxyribonuclease [Flavobacterium lacustre]|jgi:Holliday junction resolvase RusA-like endonuclease|uniref:RusA family crossover junction endodeoxyribonuclease n=1 Tax=Flavobacterium lacustre TaxID=3016339 RepID=UPI0022B65458|nr:RusA family crossover junction endodeoxyribonuclease [Flavobacterium lacustre]
MQKQKSVTFQQNPKIDFLFGYFGNLIVPTKQDGFKPIDLIETNENGEETVLKNFYLKNPETSSVIKFREYIQGIAKEKISKNNRINKPHNVQVHLSISITEKRYYEVDVDNLAKAVLDSLNEIAFEDDSQVSSLIVEKHIHPMKVNGILIAITKLTPERKGLEFTW